MHFGWPTSSWLDRMATGVFVAALMRLPRALPALRFAMEYGAGVRARAGGRRTGARTLRGDRLTGDVARDQRRLHAIQEVDREPRHQVALDVLA